MKNKTYYFCDSILDMNCCQACKYKYELNYVCTNYLDVNNNGNEELDCSVIGLNINKTYYQVVLRFLDRYAKVPNNETEIWSNSKRTLILPGYPFTLANIKEKLKSYLIFS